MQKNHQLTPGPTLRLQQEMQIREFMKVVWKIKHVCRLENAALKTLCTEVRAALSLNSQTVPVDAGVYRKWSVIQLQPQENVAMIHSS